MAGNVIAPHIQAAMHVGAQTLGRFTGIHHRTNAWQVGDKLAAAIGAVDTELSRNILSGHEHPWPVDCFAQVDHAPAIQRVDARRAKVGGGGFEHGGDLLAAHVREALHQHRRCAGHMGRSHGGAVFVGPVGGQVAQVGAVDDRAENFGTGCRHTEARRITAT